MLTTARRFESPLTLWLTSAKGPITWSKDRIEIGRSVVGPFKAVKSIAAVRQRIPWLAVLLFNAIFVCGIGAKVIQMSWQRPVKWILIGAGNLLLIGSTVTTKWIRIELINSADIQETAYLMPSTAQGKRRFDGAVEELIPKLGAAFVGDETA